MVFLNSVLTNENQYLYKSYADNVMKKIKKHFPDTKIIKVMIFVKQTLHYSLKVAAVSKMFRKDLVTNLQKSRLISTLRSLKLNKMRLLKTLPNIWPFNLQFCVVSGC